MSDADLFVGGRIFTGRRYCDALLVEDGRVRAAGAEREVRGAAPTGAAVHHLRGTLVIPGLIDSHFHVADVTRFREGLGLTGVASIDALVEAVRSWAVAHPSGAVVGRGWDQERFTGRAWPTREDIDRAVPDRPVLLIHVSGHAAVANSSALDAARFDRSTVDPPGGRIGREASGRPDGRVFERALDLLEAGIGRSALPDPTALARTLRSVARLGITTVGAMSARPEEATTLMELAAAGALPGRVRVYLRGDRWEEYFRRAPTPTPPGRFEVVGVKAYTDGAFGTRTAWLSEPYSDAPGISGMGVAVDSDLRGMLRSTAERGLVPALHAIGDRAVAYAIERLAEFPRASGPPGRIEHASLTPPPLFGPLARYRPALVVQPGFVWSDAWLPERLGRARARWAYAFRSLIDQGLLLVGSSDAPYDPVDPWRGIRAAVQRTDPEGRSANPSPEEALFAEEAVQLYTANAGAALGEGALGLLEPGSPADLLVLDTRTLEEAVLAGHRQVLETWVEGARLVIGSEPAGPETV